MIEVVGLKSIDKNQLINNLYIEGLREGIKKSSIDKRNLENGMLIKMSELSWIGIQIKGTKALVEIVEKKEAPPIINKTDYCDIVASKNAVISKMLVLNGDGVVKDGDTVKVGQKLVSGTILREGMEPRYVHSMAQVTARTWYEEAEEIALSQIEYNITGNTTSQYKLRILGKDFGKNAKISFDDYNEYVEEKNILSFGDFVFPIKIIKTKYVELMAVEKKLTEEQAKERCTERLNGKIKLQIPQNAVILNKKIDFYVDEKSVTGKITVEILEDIGVKQKIAAMTNVE
jgi:similar to stage IV sporulation protein